MRACKCPNCGAQLKVIDDDREFMFCEYCGTRVDLADYRTVHTEHIIDEAKVKDAEAKIKNAEAKAKHAEAKMKKAEAFSRFADAFASPFEAARDKRLAEEAMERQLKEEARIQQEKAKEANAHFKLSLIVLAGKAFQYIGKHPKETLTAFAIIIVIVSGASFFSNVNAEHKASSTAARIEMGEVQYPEISSTTVDYRDIQKELRDAGFTNITLIPVHDLRATEYYRENRIIEVTVDGAPTPKKNGWYSADVPIIIKYHMLQDGVTANSSTIDGLRDAASDAQDIFEDALDSAVDSLLSSLSDASTKER